MGVSASWTLGKLPAHRRANAPALDRRAVHCSAVGQRKVARAKNSSRDAEERYGGKYPPPALPRSVAARNSRGTALWVGIQSHELTDEAEASCAPSTSYRKMGWQGPKPH